TYKFHSRLHVPPVEFATPEEQPHWDLTWNKRNDVGRATPEGKWLTVGTYDLGVGPHEWAHQFLRLLNSGQKADDRIVPDLPEMLRCAGKHIERALETWLVTSLDRVPPWATELARQRDPSLTPAGAEDVASFLLELLRGEHRSHRPLPLRIQFSDLFIRAPGDVFIPRQPRELDYFLQQAAPALAPQAPVGGALQEELQQCGQQAAE